MEQDTLMRKASPAGSVASASSTDDIKKDASAAAATPVRWIQRDYTVLVIFFLLYIAGSGAIMGFGNLAGWHADNSYTSTDPRFIPEPEGANEAANYYWWQLPPDQANSGTRAAAWILYALHQVTVWILILMAKDVHPKYSSTVRWFNWAALFANFLFFVLQIVQTHVWYDGLAKDTPIASSQGSVIMLLVFVLVIEYKDRGLFFGWPTTASKGKWSMAMHVSNKTIQLVRKWHGIAFVWAAIYTQHYHPCESTWGHFVGFLYTNLILLQGSLMFTQAHLNKYWRLFLETFVVVHAATVAAQTGMPGDIASSLMWMFLFGFLFMLFFTGIYGLAFWKKLPTWTRAIPPVAFVIGCCVAYGKYLLDSNGNPWTRINEVIRIPAILYGFAALSFLVLLGLEKARNYITRDGWAPTKVRRYILWATGLLMYVVVTALGIPVEYLGPKDFALFGYMTIFVLVYCGVGLVSFLVLELGVEPSKQVKPSEDNESEYGAVAPQ